MRVLQFLPASIAAFAATTATFPTSADPDPLPSAAPLQFEPLFFGKVELGKEDEFSGPFGTRMNVPINGFNWTDVNTGKLAATLVSPTADTGLVSESGIFFPNAVLTMRWEADGKLAFFSIKGIGTLFKSSLFYVHVETDSEHYKWLNSRFLVTNVTTPPNGDGGDPMVTIYGAKLVD